MEYWSNALKTNAPLFHWLLKETCDGKQNQAVRGVRRL
jgi:hypothetical protein